MTDEARGTFEVSLKPLAEADPAISSLALEKVFSGDLVGTSVGQMLGLRTAQEGSAGYVAIERVTGTLAGRHGSFALQHTGTMDRGAASATISVVPDSGSQDLTGIRGVMKITVASGKHEYRFDYTLPNE